MIIVLDTSAAIEIVLRRKTASKLGQLVADAERVISPCLYIAEITNVFWKYFQFSDMPVDVCEKSIDTAISLPDDFISELELYREAFGLACITRKPVYDMLYLVLARRNNAHVMTMDEILKTTAVKQGIHVL